MAPSPAVDRRLQRLASAFTPNWLAAQRWYRAKSRRVERVEVVDAGKIGGTSGWLLVLEATDTSGGSARYLVPAVGAGDALREPQDGDGVWRALAALMLDGGELTGASGVWTFAPTAAAAAVFPGGAAALGSQAERHLGVEQSNTSVAVGETLILKTYRLVEPGLNPEVEMNDFLTEVGFPEAPALAGSASYHLDGKLHSAGMLQQLVRSSGDGWSWMLDRLGSPPGGPSEALGAVAEIGRLTAAMHAALASRPAAPGFPSRRATSEELIDWAGAARRQLSTALGAVIGDDHGRMASVAPQVAAGLDAIEQAAGTRVSRIHGDYHLGQLLRTLDGFAVIDFEGEPARPMAERRAPASPVRDLAGMLRSLDYAAHAAEVPSWTPYERAEWLSLARESFFDGYGGIDANEAPLLAAFELEKACYEVAYEANNRPDWTWLPLEAIERHVSAGPS